MDADDLCDLSATAAARLIASRQISPVELTEAVLARADRLDPILNLFALRLDDAARQRAHDRRTVLFRAVQDLFERCDVIATPTMTVPPPRLDAGGSVATLDYAAWAAPLYPFNLTGHPAISVPAGFTASGLPVGLQLVAPWFAERPLLNIAESVCSFLKKRTKKRPLG